MRPIDIAAGVSFLVAGALTTSFGLFSVLGTGVGVLMASGTMPAQSADEQIVGGMLSAVYFVFMLVGLGVGPFQLAAGVRLFLGKRDILLWIATFASLLPVITVYCALFTLIAFGLGLAALLWPEPEETEDDGPLAHSSRRFEDGADSPFAPPVE